MGETSLASVSFGWLWAGLLLLLLVITGMTSLFGYLEVITSSLVAFRPSMLPYKPLLGFIVLIFLFLVDLLPSSFFLLPSSFFLLPSSFFLLPSSFSFFFFFFLFFFFLSFFSFFPVFSVF